MVIEDDTEDEEDSSCGQEGTWLYSSIHHTWLAHNKLLEDLSELESDFIDNEDDDSSTSEQWREHMPSTFQATVSLEVHFHRFLKTLLSEILDWNR
jgi:hypothetical protein